MPDYLDDLRLAHVEMIEVVGSVEGERAVVIELYLAAAREVDRPVRADVLAVDLGDS